MLASRLDERSDALNFYVNKFCFSLPFINFLNTKKKDGSMTNVFHSTVFVHWFVHLLDQFGETSTEISI